MIDCDGGAWDNVLIREVDADVIQAECEVPRSSTTSILITTITATATRKRELSVLLARQM